MIEKISKVECHGCHACENACPTNAITMTVDEEGFWYPKVNYDACTKCGLCIRVCSSLTPIPVTTKRKGYAAFNKDDSVRMKSSSGGIFTLLAQKVLNQNGIVFGAAFNEKNEVVHMGINLESELWRLRGSKYVQSKIGTTFKECRKALNDGRQVLFSGTPCQIAGLRSFLLKPYANLYTVDIICHGVPSPKVWEYYKTSISNNSHLENIQFRDKSLSWENFSFRYLLNGQDVNQSAFENSYMKAFLHDLCLRPSCHDCKSKSLDRHSDMTIADFWGIQQVLPEMDDHKGTSFIITHNEKGEQMLADLSGEILCKEANVDQAVKYNSAAIKSVVLKKQRQQFMSEVNSENFAQLVNKLTKKPISKKVKDILLRAGSKVKRTILKVLG